MNARTEERVGGWDSRPFSRGHAGLRDLADEEFSGIVETGDGAWLCMLNGKVVGVFEGSIGDFDDADGTAFVAPDPALPLLFAMEELGGTLEEQYYTKDTPISEADGTLTSGSFTGYIELSENVLSGDYYVCYYGGRSMPVAFVGSSERLMTGDEAFERADDEVGIYDVYSVDVEVTEIPGGETDGQAAGSDADRSAAGATHGGGRGREESARRDDGRDDPAAGVGGSDRGRRDRGSTARAGDGDRGDRSRADGRDGRDQANDREDRARAANHGDRVDEDRARRDDGGGSGTRRDDGGGSGTRRDDPDRRHDDRSRGGDADDGGGLGASGPPLDDDNPLGDLSEQLQAAERQEPSIGGPAPGAASDDPDDDRQTGDARGGTTDDPLAGGANGADTDASADDRSRETGRGDPVDGDRTRQRPADETGDRSGRGRDADEETAGWDSPGDATGDEGSDPVAGNPTREDHAVGDQGREDHAARGRASGTDPADRDGANRGRNDPVAGSDAGHRDGAGRGDADRRTDPDRTDQARGTGADRGDPAYRDDAGTAGTRDAGGRDTARNDSGAAGQGNVGEESAPGRTGRSDSGGNDGQPGRPEGGSGGRGNPGDPVARDGSRGANRQREGRQFEDEAAWRDDRSVPSIASEEEREELVAELREGIRERESEIERLRERVSALEGDHDDYESEHERLREAIEEVTDDLGDLRRTVLRLDEDIERIRSAGDGDPPDRAATDAAGGTTGDAPAVDGPDLTADQALAGTKLLVRYGSQGKPTLKTAHDGGADRQAVNDNLRLDVHTDFPAEGATVDGRPFGEFLDSRMEREFVEWLVRDLPFEIRETGNDAALQDLYDAIPRIDRVEFAGRVTIEYLDDEGRDPEHIDFDVVARDDREQPLVVANFDASGDPATQGMVVELNDRAGQVREAGPLNAAFLVTSSYFDGQARDTASEATSGSFLSRDSRKSFVNLSRKRGYHLCLVESRGGDLHVRVPEL